MLDSKSGIIVSALSDHFPVFISSDRISRCSIRPPKFVTLRVNDLESKQKLVNELIEIDIYSKMDKNLCTNPNYNYKILEEELQKCKEKHMPIKTVKYNKHKHKKNAWITFGIIKSIKSRDKLYVKLKSTPKDDPYYESYNTNLKTYNRIIKKLIREAQIKYFSEKFEKYKNDIKNTWKTINEVLYMGKKEKKKICKLIIDEKPITDTKQICIQFNNFFTNIGPKLAKEIPTPTDTTVEKFLKQQIATSFKFELTSIQHNKKKS